MTGKNKGGRLKISNAQLNAFHNADTSSDPHLIVLIIVKRGHQGNLFFLTLQKHWHTTIEMSNAVVCETVSHSLPILAMLRKSLFGTYFGKHQECHKSFAHFGIYSKWEQTHE